MKRVLKDLTAQNLTLGDPVEVFEENAVFSMNGQTLASSGGLCLIDMFFVKDGRGRKPTKAAPNAVHSCDDFLRIAPSLDIPELSGYSRRDARFTNRLKCVPHHFDIKYAEQSDSSVWSAKATLASMDMDLSVETLSQRLRAAATDTKTAHLPASAASIVQRGNNYAFETLSEQTCDGYRLLEFNMLKLPPEVQN